MTMRVALRSLSARPVRSAVMACGFGFGIGCMAGLLGIGEVIVEQARSPALEGGGDVIVVGSSGQVASARFVMSSVLGAPPLSDRVVAASPSSRARLYLVEGHEVVAVDARGGIPSLERALGDPEVSALDVWVDAPSDAPWSSPDPASVLRAMDRFHPIPDVPERAASWIEWLYFNGSAGEVGFYLSLMVGPEQQAGLRRARLRLQLDRDGRREDYSDEALLPAREVLEDAPDIRIGASGVRLEGLRYHIDLALHREIDGVVDPTERRTPALSGRITLDAVPGRSLPPYVVRGARGWISGYVVPVLSGPVNGSLAVGDEVVDLNGGSGYHDHNWGFWDGVTWQWGQVAGDGLSLVFGRIRPPADAADPNRLPGFLMALGREGPLGFSTNVSIREQDDPDAGRPHTITVTAQGETLDLRMVVAIDGVVATRFDREGSGLEFLQMRGEYRVTGRVGETEVDFTARGAAETYRGG